MGAMEKVSKQTKKYFLKANNIWFGRIQGKGVLGLGQPMDICNVYFDIEVQAYTNVGPGKKFQVDFWHQTFKPIHLELVGRMVACPIKKKTI